VHRVDPGLRVPGVLAQARRAQWWALRTGEKGRSDHRGGDGASDARPRLAGRVSDWPEQSRTLRGGPELPHCESTARTKCVSLPLIEKGTNVVRGHSAYHARGSSTAALRGEAPSRRSLRNAPDVCGDPRQPHDGVLPQRRRTIMITRSPRSRGDISGARRSATTISLQGSRSATEYDPVVDNDSTSDHES
jgi:hypothetical protein